MRTQTLPNATARKAIKYITLALGIGTAAAALIFCAVEARAALIQRIDQPVDGTLINPCNGESVHLVGTSHIEYRLTVTGNTLHLGYHVNFQDVAGVGLTTGAIYHLTDSATININVAKGESVAEPEDRLLIAQGTVPNFIMHDLVHITVNANGNVTAFVETEKTYCL